MITKIKKEVLDIYISLAIETDSDNTKMEHFEWWAVR